MAERPAEEQRRHGIAGEVSERLEGGSVRAAKQALSRAWRELVPELPSRFSVPLRRVDPKAVAEVRRRMARSGKRPPLKLRRDEGRVWVETARGRRLRLGRLPSAEANLLEELNALSKYRPKLLRVEQDELGQVSGVVVELVRPLQRICPACGKVHEEGTPLCADCRESEGEVVERAEGAPVDLQEAIDDLARQAEDFPEV